MLSKIVMEKIAMEFLDRAIRKEKELKDTEIEMKENYLHLKMTWSFIQKSLKILLSLIHPRTYTHTHTQPVRKINESSKVAGYRNSTQISVVFLYANNEQPEKKVKKTSVFSITIKRKIYRLKYLINMIELLSTKN